MGIVYRIYANDGAGGAVDFTTPVASTTDLTYVTPPLPVSSDFTFAVRAYDPTTGFEEANTDAVARAVVSPLGDDATGRPNAPHAVVLSPSPSGGCKVVWAYGPDRRCGTPDGFRVYVGPPGSPAGRPAATVGYHASQVGYASEIAGPFAFAPHTAVVESYNAAGSATGAESGPCEIGPPPTPLLMDGVTARVVGFSNTWAKGLPF